MPSSFPITDPATFAARRRALMQRLGETSALVAAGAPVARNYPANVYPFRASSHFLYLVGRPIEGAYLLLSGGEATLFATPPDRDDALWHGPRPSLEALGKELGVERVAPLDTMVERCSALPESLATLPPQEAETAKHLKEVCGRPVRVGSGAELSDHRDVALADAMIALRLQHDEGAKAQLRAAAGASSEVHALAMRVTKSKRTEAEVCAAMIGELRARGMDDAYPPIVTIHGEVLHAHGHPNDLEPGSLLLCDVGGESPEGWASDITRTWPTSGTFSATQRAIYEIVLGANVRAIAKVRAGTSYRACHEEAKRAIVEGLVAVGILSGDVDGLLERGAANVFFPHGVGHLLGLDVHDMEDLGDRAGYAPGRSRSQRFGDRYLRLDRDLAPGMAVTIEPGFYQVPGILSDEALVGPLGDDLHRDVLAKFADVRGIRVEDDVLCTDGDPEVMTRACPKAIEEIEALMR